VTGSIHSITRTAAELLLLPIGLLAVLGSIPSRWAEAWSDAIDGPWDLSDPYLTGDPLA
jgi:hypothetical protein